MATDETKADDRARRRKDGWDILQALSGVMLGLVGLYFTFTVNREQDRSRRYQTATQLMSSREQSEMQFRATMFGTLLDRLLSSDRAPEQQLTVLRLFEHNFHDSFNGRAFFDALESRAGSARNRDEFLQHLSALGREVSFQQEGLVDAALGTSSPSLSLGEGAGTTVWIRADGYGDHADSHRVDITLLEVEPYRARVRLVVANGHNADEAEPNEFWVEYFDTPFTDNRLLPDGHRLALILKNADAASNRARLKLVRFPAHFIVTGYRPSVEHVTEMLGEMRAGGTRGH